MNPQSANEYVAALKRNGAGDQAVIAILRNAGWPEKEAVAALSSYYQALTGLAAPSRLRSIGGPREAFLHLLSFLTLAVWCTAAGSLWFTLIDFWFPDPAARVFGDPLGGMALSLASVLVAFPVFLLVMRVVWRELLGQPVQADSALRRWLTYLALLVAAGAMIGDLVAFVEHLLRGEITARFAAKVVAVLVLAGGVFWFYVRSVQPGGEARGEGLRRHGRAGAAAAAGLVVLTLALSFAKFGSPARQRLSASDDRRSEDLEAIARVIRSRWIAARGEETPKLPQSIAELPESATLRLTDPISGVPYRYSPLGGARYELCARFQADTTQIPVQRRRSLFRAHPAGDYCFVVDAPASLP
ncbi:MAG: hypothetical protein HY822_15865 [Acidobacteria bacterium]|nr:hypothetical protein [Acidobacteriota bacterium]